MLKKSDEDVKKFFFLLKDFIELLVVHINHTVEIVRASGEDRANAVAAFHVDIVEEPHIFTTDFGFLK